MTTAAPSAPPAARWRWILVSAALIALAAVLVALRRPDALRNPQFWAEDAVIFHLQAHTEGAASVVLPHAGYHHLVPRLTALGARVLDPLYHPTFYNVTAFVLTVLVIAAVMFTRFGDRLGVSIAAGLALLLAPHTSHEVFLTITNIQWFLAPYLVWLIIRPAADRPWQVTTGTLGALLASLTSPLSALLLPLAAWRTWQERAHPRGWIPLAVLMVGGLVQGMAIKQAPDQWSDGAAASPAMLLQIVGERLVVETFLPALMGKLPAGASLAIGVAVLLGIAALALRPGPRRATRILLALGLLVFIAATLARARDQAHLLLAPGYGDRYFYSMRVLLLWLGLFAAWDGGRWTRGVVAAAVLALVVSLPDRFTGPVWPDQRWEDFAPALRRGEAVDVPILPPGWTYHHPGDPAASAP